MDNATCTHLGTISATVEFDLANYSDLAYVNYLKIVGLDDDGAYPGYDLDAVEAFHPIAHIGLDSGLPAPSVILLATVGTGLVAWLRRRRNL